MTITLDPTWMQGCLIGQLPWLVLWGAAAYAIRRSKGRSKGDIGA
jgi:hypothetical protein